CTTRDDFFFSSRRRHTRCLSDWSSDVCSSDLRPGRTRHRLEEQVDGGLFIERAQAVVAQIEEALHLQHAGEERLARLPRGERFRDRKSTRLNSSHLGISYAVFCLKKKKNKEET